MKLYKVLGPARQSCHGGTHVWEPGVWYTVTGELKPCEHGFHLCRARDLLSWIKPDVWRAEVRGEQITADNKVVARSARITTKTALDAVNRTGLITGHVITPPDPVASTMVNVGLVYPPPSPVRPYNVAAVMTPLVKVRWITPPDPVGSVMTTVGAVYPCPPDMITGAPN